MQRKVPRACHNLPRLGTNQFAPKHQPGPKLSAQPKMMSAGKRRGHKACVLAGSSLLTQAAPRLTQQTLQQLLTAELWATVCFDSAGKKS